MGEILVKGGALGEFTAIVDDTDVDRLSKFRWYLHGGYARRYEKGGRYGSRTMHRDVLSAVDGQVCDHVNGNRLDNRRANLRIVDKLANAQNAKKRADNTSGFKGVSWHARLKKWRAQIQVNGRKKHIGVFKCKITAAKAFDTMAKEHFGEYARLNFP